MYQIEVKVLFEDNSTQQKTFDYWSNVAAWFAANQTIEREIEYLDNENESLPKTVTMQIIR